MIVNSHTLIGYHGCCKYCNKPLITDLGYCSWDDITCIDREITDYCDIPDNIKSLASFKGLVNVLYLPSLIPMKNGQLIN